MTRLIDPFRAGPALDSYVRLPAFEQNCRYLAAKLDSAPTWVGVTGAAGVGKTLLLRLILRRMSSRFTCVYVPTSALAPSEVWRWTCDQLGFEAGDSDRASASRLAAEGRPILLAIDEGQLASPELVAWIEAVCSAEVGARAVVAWTEFVGEGTPPALIRCPVRVFVEPLELQEVPAYIETQLARVEATPQMRAVLEGRTIDRIALASGGNPRLIQRLADAELAAHAWRARHVEPLRARVKERATSSAPRPSPELGAQAARSGWGLPHIAFVAAVAVALGASALAFLFSR